MKTTTMINIFKVLSVALLVISIALLVLAVLQFSHPLLASVGWHGRASIGWHRLVHFI